MPAVLFVFTSVNKTLTGIQTGWYLPEAAHPYYILSPHATIDFASPAGPNPPVDEGSIQAFANDEDSVKFLNDETVKAKFASTKKLTEINVKDYDAIFYVGGHGPVIDLSQDPDNIKLASEASLGEPSLWWKRLTRRNSVLPSRQDNGSSVPWTCSSRAIVGAVDASGKSVFSGKAFTGLSNAEEEIVGKIKDVPFLLQDKITALGGKYEKASEPWAVKVVVDGHLFTGQNPASAAPLAREILKAL
ncbi:hypothetical protein AX17_001270 [Amanita inopinata Kibby_2008]|nr:hypothetical protein AX17_001270 [Amanita inopinata Kibby_2008]